MKKILLLFVLMMGIAVYASAEKRTYYVVSSLENPEEDAHGEYCIDVEKKTFVFSGGGTAPIRNYKKKGAVETFGTWDDELETISFEITLETGEQTTMKFKSFDGRKFGYVVSTTKPIKVKSPNQAAKEKKGNVIDEGKAKIKKLFKKGK